MKLSTNSRYGLRALIDLAVHCTGEPVALCDIAERQHISESYLEQAFATLRRAGFIRSFKGSQGGYVPAEDFKNLKVGTVLRVLEGDLSIIDDSPVYTGDDAIKLCIKSVVWDVVDRNVSQVLDSVTLHDLAENYIRMRGDAQKEII